MSTILRFLGGTALGLYLGTRMGVFGKCIVKINQDDEYATITHWPFWNTAYWNPAGANVRYYQPSLRPIVFERTQEYSGWHEDARPM
jgi:hypothetical protein